MNNIQPTSDATYQLRRSLTRLEAHPVSQPAQTLVHIDTRHAPKALDQAARRPLRTGFLWMLGNELGRIVGGLLSLLVTLAVLAGLAGAAYYGLKKTPDTTKHPPASKQPTKAAHAARGYTSESERAANKQ